ncbi:hypothetical protein [Thermobrachium celere]|nr:hypothetical protein [Thermobrachium celere]
MKVAKAQNMRNIDKRAIENLKSLALFLWKMQHGLFLKELKRGMQKE